MDDDKTGEEKCIQAINAIHELMERNGIDIPLTNQKSGVYEGLPETPERREVEISRRLDNFEPDSKTQLEKKLKDLLAYAEIAQLLRSELIAIIVLSKLRKWEQQLINPEQDRPPLPTKDEQDQRQKNIRERNRRTAETLKRFAQQGQDRRGAIQSMGLPKIGDVRPIRLPPNLARPAPPLTLGEQQAVDRRLAEVIVQREEQGRARAAAARPRQFGDDARKITFPQQTIPAPGTTGEWRQNIQERNRRADEEMKLHQDQGRARAAAAALSPKFGDDARKVRLPQQFIPLPPPPPGTTSEYLEYRQNIQERNRRAVEEIEQRKDQGKARVAAAALSPQFGDDARRIRLPHQTIASPNTQRQNAPAPSVDVDEQRDRDMDQYKQVGGVRKKLLFMPGYDRNLKGPKLPPHGLERPTTSSSNTAQTSPSSNMFRFQRLTELQKQREIEMLQKLLTEAINLKRIPNPNRNPNPNPIPNNDDDNDDLGQTE